MEGLSSSLDQVFRPTSTHEAPALHEAVEDLCRKAGIAKPKICFVEFPSHHPLGKNPLQRFTFEHIAAALDVDSPRLILGPKFREIVDHPTAVSSISEEFKAILAHEIGHLKYKDPTLLKALPIAHAPVLGVIAGIAGMLYYNHLKEQEAYAKAAGKSSEEARHDSQKQWETSDKVNDPAFSFAEPLFNAAKVVAGGLIGFGVGAAVFGLTRRRIEFRADRVSAELMESGKPLANALKKLRAPLQEAYAADAEAQIAVKKMNPVQKILSQLTHPKDAERIRRLEAWTR